MKIKVLKKQLIKASAIHIAALIVLGGIAYGLTSYSEGTVNEKNKLSGEVALLDNQIQALRAKLKRVEEAAPMYKRLTEGGNWNKLALNRQDAKLLFDELQDQYHLVDMKVSFDAVQELKEDKFKKPKALGIAVNATTSFGALSDEYAFNVLSELKEKMPGIIKFTKVTFARDKEPGEIANANFAKEKKLVPEVRVTAEFTWYGIKEPAPPPADGNAAPGAPPAVPGAGR